MEPTKFLSANYSKHEPPLTKNGGSLKIDCKFKSIGVLGVDLQKNTIELSLLIKLHWKDERLNEKGHNYIKPKVLLFKKI